MIWPLHHRSRANYWIKVFGLYALAEAGIQLAFLFVLNRFGTTRISNIEFHAVMWIFQCLMIWPIWLVAASVRHRSILVQVFVNLLFFIVYSYCWFGPIQEAVRFFHQYLQSLLVPTPDRLVTPVDSPQYLYYQFLKHAFRLSWFFLANYFYRYRQEERKRFELAVSNKELELKLLKWHLNPDFYFRAINHLRELAVHRPADCTNPILQLAKVMEYVIYETRETIIAVSRELLFLANYIHLVNQQQEKGSRFRLETTGEYGHLAITPLLLAGLIDTLTTGNCLVPGNEYRLQVHFSGNSMHVVVKGTAGAGWRMLFDKDQDLYKKIAELYPGRFSCEACPEKEFIQLELQLQDDHK